jgi:hypothetical protein
MLRAISAEPAKAGFVRQSGKPFAATAVGRMLGEINASGPTARAAAGAKTPPRKPADIRHRSIESPGGYVRESELCVFLNLGDLICANFD